MAEDNSNDKGDKIDAGFRGVNARLDTLDTGLADVRADLGDLKAHVDEVRDALFADNARNREFVSIKVEALRSESTQHPAPSTWHLAPHLAPST